MRAKRGSQRALATLTSNDYRITTMSVIEQHSVLGMVGTLRIVELHPQPSDGLSEQLAALLADASTRLQESRGGHVPDSIVHDFVQRLYTSWDSLSRTFTLSGLRLGLLSESGSLISTVLVARDPSVALVVNSSAINVRIRDTSLPDLDCHQLFNFTTSLEDRRRGFGRILLNWLQSHSTDLRLAGKGVWSFVEPPDFQIYRGLGFQHLPKGDQYLMLGAESDNATFHQRYLAPNSITRPADRRQRLKCFYMAKRWL